MGSEHEREHANYTHVVDTAKYVRPRTRMTRLSAWSKGRRGRVSVCNVHGSRVLVRLSVDLFSAKGSRGNFGLKAS